MHVCPECTSAVGVGKRRHSKLLLWIVICQLCKLRCCCGENHRESLRLSERACLGRSAQLQPLSAAAHNALGLVEEERGAFTEAVAAFQLAEGLCSPQAGTAFMCIPPLLVSLDCEAGVS